ncbi:DNA polymerase III subunit gamma/tau [Gammaproteobacteria bacterium]
MAYQVLARKWRPHTFVEMVGQEHVLRALIHALDSGRLHHAFLFTGTRGVGKTTIARILAKSLNCEHGVSSQPCGTCAACCGIDEGRFVDLIEVDAASRTKVEDTRELLENVQYAPSCGRYKVYLIDEVHMFSNHSFNALLKTLEEPPPHVKFLLATTDPQRLPVTILSRCLQFNLRRLSLPLIRDQLARILETEGMPFEEAALRELARAADGSMRDGLSLLDQAIAYGGGRVVTQDVHAMLGTLARDRVYALLESLATGDAQALIATVESLAQQSPDWGALLGELVGLLQRVALAQFVPEAVDDHLGDRNRILALAKQMTIEDVQLHYQIGLLGRRDLPLAPQPRGGFEMVLLRMLAFRPLPEEEARPTQPKAAPPCSRCRTTSVFHTDTDTIPDKGRTSA